MKTVLLSLTLILMTSGAFAQTARENALKNLVGTPVHFFAAGLEAIKPSARRWIQSKTGADTLIVSSDCKFTVDSTGIVISTTYNPDKDTDLNAYQLATVALQNDPTCKTQFLFVPQNLDLQTGYYLGRSAQQPEFGAVF